MALYRLDLICASLASSTQQYHLSNQNQPQQLASISMSPRLWDEPRGYPNFRWLALLRQSISHQSHDRWDAQIKPMSADNVIAQTPRGSTIQKTGDGLFLVCNSESQCLFTRSLYLAEQELDGMEEGYQFPYSTSFRKKSS